LKPSRFNLYFPQEDKGEIIAYNALTGATAVFDREMIDSIRHFKNGNEKISEDFIGKLLSCGFLVDDAVDEIKIYEVRYNTRKYGSQELWINVMTTFACNLACEYCYQGHGDLINTTMSRTTTNALIKFVKNYTLKTGCKKLSLILYGGEPLLNFKEGLFLIQELDDWAEKENIDFGSGFISNGTLFTRDILQKLSKYKQRINQLTLDGPKHIHDRRRIHKNGKGTYEEIIRALELFAETGTENLFLRIDVDKNNAASIEELLDDLKKRGLQYVPIGFGLIQAKSRACSMYSSSCIVGEESRNILPSLWKLAIDKGFDLRLRPHAFFVYCGAQTNFSLMVDPEGNLYKCSNFLGMEEHRIGSIKDDGSFGNVRYEYYDWMSRNPLKIKKCTMCKYLPLCGGGCAGIAFFKHNTFHKEICSETKYLIDHQLKLYLNQQYPRKFKNGSFNWEISPPVPLRSSVSG